MSNFRRGVAFGASMGSVDPRWVATISKRIGKVSAVRCPDGYAQAILQANSPTEARIRARKMIEQAGYTGRDGLASQGSYATPEGAVHVVRVWPKGVVPPKNQLVPVSMGGDVFGGMYEDGVKKLRRAFFGALSEGGMAKIQKEPAQINGMFAFWLQRSLDTGGIKGPDKMVAELWLKKYAAKKAAAEADEGDDDYEDEEYVDPLMEAAAQWETQGPQIIMEEQDPVDVVPVPIGPTRQPAVRLPTAMIRVPKQQQTKKATAKVLQKVSRAKVRQSKTRGFGGRFLPPSPGKGRGGACGYGPDGEGFGGNDAKKYKREGHKLASMLRHPTLGDPKKWTTGKVLTRNPYKAGSWQALAWWEGAMDAMYEAIPDFGGDLWDDASDRGARAFADDNPELDAEGDYGDDGEHGYEGRLSGFGSPPAPGHAGWYTARTRRGWPYGIDDCFGADLFDRAFGGKYDLQDRRQQQQKDQRPSGRLVQTTPRAPGRDPRGQQPPREKKLPPREKRPPRAVYVHQPPKGPVKVEIEQPKNYPGTGPNDSGGMPHFEYTVEPQNPCNPAARERRWGTDSGTCPGWYPGFGADESFGGTYDETVAQLHQGFGRRR